MTNAYDVILNVIIDNRAWAEPTHDEKEKTQEIMDKLRQAGYAIVRTEN